MPGFVKGVINPCSHVIRAVDLHAKFGLGAKFAERAGIGGGQVKLPPAKRCRWVPS